METQINTKPEVFNPSKLLTPIGSELDFIFKSHNKDISELNVSNLKQKERLSKKQIVRAKDLLGLEDSFVSIMMNFQDNYHIQKQKAEYDHKQALSLFKKLKYVLTLIREEEKTGFDDLDNIVLFYGCENEEEVLNHIEVTKTFFRKQKQSDINEINLTAIIRRGEIDLSKCCDLAKYDKEKLIAWIENREWINKISNTNYFKKLPLIFKEFGICLLLYPYVPKTIHGCVKWIDKTPLIIISDRGQDIASSWFTLFHEIGHVVLHENQSIYDIDLKDSDKRKIETEANQFASKYLFGGNSLQKKVFVIQKEGKNTTKEALAHEFNTHPLLAKYWMRKANLIPQNYIDKIKFEL